MPVGAGRPWHTCEPATSQASSRADPDTAWELMATAWRESHLPREERLWNERRRVKREAGEGEGKLGKTGGRGGVNVFFI